MTITTILPTAKTVFLDTNNNPLAGGKVFFYIPNTSTPKTTWQDAGATISNANPVILDGQGSALIYGSGQYRQVLQDSLGNLIWDQLTQDTYGLVVASDNIFTGANTFTQGVSFQGGLAGFTNGGLINKFNNSVMEIAQRGTSGTITAGTPAITLDQWYVGCLGADNTWQQGGPLTFGAHSLQIGGDAGTTDTFVKQRIESSTAAQLYGDGLPITVQAEIGNNSNAVLTPTLTVNHANATDNWASFTTDVNAVSFQPIPIGEIGIIARTFQPNPGMYNGAEIIFDFGAALNLNTKSISFSATDIRSTSGIAIGINNSPPSIEMRPNALELVLCQRYFEQFNVPVLAAQAVNISPIYPYGFKVTKRVTPTMTTVTAPSYTNTASNAVFGGVSPDSVALQFTVAGTAGFLSNWVISASAEL